MKDIEIGLLIPAGMDTAALEAHLRDEAKARRRLQQEMTHRNIDRWSERTRYRDNRAKRKREAQKEAWSR